MSQTRQVASHLEAHLIVRSLAVRYPGGWATGAHRHPWAQLVFATEGVLTVMGPRGNWVVPSHRAVWLPADTEHELATAGPVGLRTLYLRQDLVAGLPAECFVLAVTPLLRELILRVIGGHYLDDRVAAQRRLADVLVDQIDPECQEPLALPLPRDARALAVADRVRSAPGSTASVAELAAGSGASARTVERLFRAQVGMSFGKWRQRVRLLRSLELLAAGESVTRVALELGYDSVSAFVVMFRRALGTTPGRYFGRPA